MPLSRLTVLAAFSLAALLGSSAEAVAGVNFVAPGVAGSVTSLTVGGQVYDVSFVGNVTHAAWVSQLDFSTEAAAQAAIVALAGELNAASATSVQFTTPGGTFNFTQGQLWYAANATTLFGETLIKTGSNWQLADPLAGGTTAPINGAFPLALDFTLVSPSPWTNLGGGIAGVTGVPQLTGTGSLATASAGSLALSSARPSAAALLFVSLSSVPTPFKGGVMVAVPPVLIVPLATDALGALQLAFTWPAGVPSGTSLYFQLAVQDVAAVKAVSLSNALKAVTP
jgi:hypothetical protein